MNIIYIYFVKKKKKLLTFSKCWWILYEVVTTNLLSYEHN